MWLLHQCLEEPLNQINVREAPQHEHCSGCYAPRQDVHDDEERKPLICEMMIIVMVVVVVVMLLAIVVIKGKKNLRVLAMMAIEIMRRNLNPEAGLFARKLKT